MKNKAKILTAKDFAAQEGAVSVRERIKMLVAKHQAKGIYFDTPFRDGPTAGEPVIGFVNQGRWVANCECGGAEAVDPDEPFFYCFECGNCITDGSPRLVIFPQDITAIEAELLKRPVIELRGRNAIERAFQALPGVGLLSRNWTPDESLADLQFQNRELEKRQKE